MNKRNLQLDKELVTTTIDAGRMIVFTLELGLSENARIVQDSRHRHL